MTALKHPLGFTALDTGLVGVGRFIDPLGVGPMWTNLARRVVPHLTVTSPRADGFEIVLTLVDLFERYQVERAKPSLDFSTFFIVGEQILAHATYKYRRSKEVLERECWRLPGVTRIRAAFGSRLEVGLHHQLVNAQLGGGAWGNYAAAAERGGVIHLKERRLTAEAHDHVRSSRKRFPWIESRKAVFTVIERAAQNGSATLNKADWLADAGKYLHQDSAKLPHVDLLRLMLVERPKYPPSAPVTPTSAGLVGVVPVSRTPLLKEVAERLQASGAETMEAFHLFVQEQAVAEWDAELFGDGNKLFADILRAEHYTAALTHLFDRLFEKSGFSPEAAAADLDLPLEELRTAQAELRDVFFTGDSARGRARIHGSLELTTGAALIRSLVSAHETVSAQRSNAPWLVIEGGKLLPLVDYTPGDPRPLRPTQCFDNTYYLAPLLGLVTDLSNA